MLNLDIQEAIQSFLSTRSTKQLKKDFQHISESYRDLDCQSIGSTKADVDAYLIGRLPLTLAVIQHVFQLIQPYLSSNLSLLDYGCGPATTLLAIKDNFEQITYHGVEEKKAMLEAALFLTQSLELKAEFFLQDALKDMPKNYDLVMASYLLNELDDRISFYERLLTQANSVLLIEPGTPDGYKRLMEFRKKALEANWHVLAPCPHESECPLSKGPSWCHFYTRVSRTRQLKEIKQASMGYEDEKFCFLFVSKQNAFHHHGVVLEKPVIYPFKVTFKACTDSGKLEDVEIMKKNKEDYKKAKKLSWGDFI